jgi:hypothetical protein
MNNKFGIVIYLFYISTMKEYNFALYALNLIYIDMLKDIKWYKFKERSKIHRWRENEIKKLSRG